MARMDGAVAMKQIYDDLGIYKPLSWHSRGDDDNVAHNWNSGEDMETIWRKLLDGSGEWDTSITKAISDGTLSRETVGSAQEHYNTFSVNDSSIPTAEDAIAGDLEYSQEYTKDYWTGQVDDFTVAGKEGLDMSPHDSALNTWYAQERIDQGLDDEEYGTQALREINENLEDRFLDDVYDNEGNVNEGVEAHWGLDLRRVGLGHTRQAGGDWKVENWGDVLSDSYYETLTRGEVNWASYRNDSAYIAAFKEMADRADNDDDPNTNSSDWAIETLGTQANRTADYVNMVRTVNKETDVIQHLIKGDDGGWKVDWEGKYDPDKIVANGEDLYIDGHKQTTTSELYARDYDGIDPETGERWEPSKRGRLLDPADYPMTLDEPIKEQIAQVVKPNIRIPKVTVTKPHNIPDSWDVGAGEKSFSRTD